MSDTNKELTVNTDLENIIEYNGYKTEEYIDRYSGTPYHKTREVPIIDVEKTIENLVNVVNELRREIAILKSKQKDL
ncbi:MAG: hypothetical protein Edafosvirus5_11 [Edafosvirus sp.]|uniref:Uncharacterized protein n=1 Tax=Edafosvirus sp. TaxID=2487765 RepID=A0A3G4ZWX3_9VIRU|nr:MAG: hypothetical protein Edafosvirus5_11 [Edafosvirus sp.]